MKGKVKNLGKSFENNKKKMGGKKKKSIDYCPFQFEEAMVAGTTG